MSFHLNESKLRSIIREELIRSMGGLPGSVKFVPGVTFTKSNDLIGDSWRRSLLSRMISGDQPAAVLRTNTPGSRVSPD